METTKDYAEKMDVIFTMIENSKSKLRDNAFFYLLWGWLVLIASLSNFIMIRMEVYNSYIVWPVLMTIGGIVSVIAGSRMGKKSTHRTHIDTSMKYLWMGFIFTLFMVLGFSIAGKIPWNINYAIIISLYGMGTFVSGGVLKFKPLIIGGIACWIIAPAVLFVPPIYSYLLLALSIIVAYLIPGYLLRSSR